jgi:antitoxin component of MazEF toxin-antitoxin module
MNSISNLLAEFKFVGKISKMGNNKVIWIPKEFHDQITDLEGKQVRIVIDDKI